MIDRGWLQDLKAGDDVIVDGRRGRRLAKVERTTKTQIILAGTTVRFRKKDGHVIGGSTWNFHHLSRVTADNLADINLEKHISAASGLLKKIADSKKAGLTLEQAQQVINLAKQIQHILEG